MDNGRIETHPWGFFLPPHAKILMLGSFPPKPERWSMDFYYPNFINDFWRIMGILFFGEKEYFIIPGEKKFDKQKALAFCEEKGIAMGDTAESVIRLKDNASDKFLEVVKPMNPEEILPRIPECRTIVVTGQKAMDTFRTLIEVDEPKVGSFSVFDFHGREMRLYRMPSTSRAYPMSLDQKTDVYREVFKS